MKIFNKHKILLSCIIIICCISCSKSFIDLPVKGEFVIDNYYKDEGQVYTGLVAVYDVLRKNAGGFENMITMLNAISGDQYAGGGGPSDGVGIHACTHFTLNGDNIPESYWNDHYQGIFRANLLLQKITDVPMDEDVKARFIAETKTLRALYYFNLVRMFKNIPLILEVLTNDNMRDVSQASPEEVYAQIEKDLTEAIPALPANLTDDLTELGRLTKGAAQAMLGKVYLFEGKNELAAQQFSEVNGTPGQTSQYGYKLVDNFSDLWSFDNKFNSEAILFVLHSNKSNNDWGFWGAGNDEGNSVNQMVGPRGYTAKNSSAPDIPAGWGFNIFNKSFINMFKTDPRYAATVLDVASLKAAGSADYEIGDEDSTGCFIKKFIPKNSDRHTGGGAVELNYQQTDYIIRLADTYLLEAEALGATGARAQALLDAVRARVGLPSVPVSMQAIKEERRIELAGEGHRFFDLVRWGDATTVLGSRGFREGKSEIFPIPTRELQGTKLVQNPGYN